MYCTFSSTHTYIFYRFFIIQICTNSFNLRIHNVVEIINWILYYFSILSHSVRLLTGLIMFIKYNFTYLLGVSHKRPQM